MFFVFEYIKSPEFLVSKIGDKDPSHVSIGLVAVENSNIIYVLYTVALIVAKHRVKRKDSSDLNCGRIIIKSTNFESD